ncbi:MAG: hypothetical protein R3C59_00610 [Planctomycetaceae bacterium]
MSSLQQMIDETSSGGTVEFPREGCEFIEAVSIDRPLTLNGRGGTIAFRTAPVVRVTSPKVVLRNVKILYHGRGTAKESTSTALLVTASTAPRIRDVELSGQVSGIPGEDGLWRLPKSLRLGKVACEAGSLLTVRIVLPIDVIVLSEIAEVEVGRELSAGTRELQLHVQPLAPGTRLSGDLCLQTSLFTRRIRLNLTASDKAAAKHHSGAVVWQAEEWQSLNTDAPSVPVDSPTAVFPGVKSSSKESSPAAAASEKSADPPPGFAQRRIPQKLSRASTNDSQKTSAAADSQSTDSAFSSKKKSLGTPKPQRAESVPLAGIWSDPLAEREQAAETESDAAAKTTGPKKKKKLRKKASGKRRSSEKQDIGIFGTELDDDTQG